MAIIEVHGGPITHRYLLSKKKEDLASLYMRLLRDTERDARDAERYRWLRDRIDAAEVDDAHAARMALTIVGPILHRTPDPDYCEELDAAIDAAMNGANA